MYIHVVSSSATASDTSPWHRSVAERFNAVTEYFRAVIWNLIGQICLRRDGCGTRTPETCLNCVNGGVDDVIRKTTPPAGSRAVEIDRNGIGVGRPASFRQHQNHVQQQQQEALLGLGNGPHSNSHSSLKTGNHHSSVLSAGRETSGIESHRLQPPSRVHSDYHRLAEEVDRPATEVFGSASKQLLSPLTLSTAVPDVSLTTAKADSDQPAVVFDVNVVENEADSVTDGREQSAAADDVFKFESVVPADNRVEPEVDMDQVDGIVAELFDGSTSTAQEVGAEFEQLPANQQQIETEDAGKGSIFSEQEYANVMNGVENDNGDSLFEQDGRQQLLDGGNVVDEQSNNVDEANRLVGHHAGNEAGHDSNSNSHHHHGHHHQTQHQTQQQQHHRLPCWDHEAHSRQCLNDGRCFAVELRNGLRRTGCSCTARWTGERCEMRYIDPSFWDEDPDDDYRMASVSADFCLLIIASFAFLFTIYMYTKNNRRRRPLSATREASLSVKSGHFPWCNGAHLGIDSPQQRLGFTDDCEELNKQKSSSNNDFTSTALFLLAPWETLSSSGQMKGAKNACYQPQFVTSNTNNYMYTCRLANNDSSNLGVWLTKTTELCCPLAYELENRDSSSVDEAKTTSQSRLDSMQIVHA